MDCLGCKLANQQLPINVVFEDRFVCCFLDHDPYNEGHVLILPKNHIRYFDELDEKTTSSIMKATKKISKVLKELYKPDGITVIQNGGSCDDLTHFHIHIVPRYKGQNFADFFAEDELQVAMDDVKLLETKRKIVEAIYRL